MPVVNQRCTSPGSPAGFARSHGAHSTSDLPAGFALRSDAQSTRLCTTRQPEAGVHPDHPFNTVAAMDSPPTPPISPKATFDPIALRKAIADFHPPRAARFERLLPARDAILELRRKRASFASISEILSQHGLPTSKSTVAAFCRDQLNEGAPGRRRSDRSRRSEPAPEVGQSEPPSAAAQVTEIPAPTVGAERARGPRIAKLRFTPSP